MKQILSILSFVLLFGLSAQGQDKLASLRTSKQIITLDEVSSAYTVQILALRLPPSDASFFKNLDEVYEYPCTDGYVRYGVGGYNSFAEANAAIGDIRAKGYEDAFVANTNNYKMKGRSSGKMKIDPNSDYVVQLAAFRYPVYLTFFENVDNVYEYRLNDKIFRYTTTPVKGSEVEGVLSQMKQLGYKNAFIVEYDKYAPFKIE